MFPTLHSRGTGGVCSCDTGSRRADVCGQLNLVPLLLSMLRDPNVKSSDQLQLILTLNHWLDGARLFSLSLSLSLSLTVSVCQFGLIVTV